MPQCRGKTDAGKQCTRQVADGHWCYQHPPEDAFDEMDENGHMTQAAFARLIERSDERVRQYRKRGIFGLEDDGKIDVAGAIEALVVHGDLSRSSLPFDLYEKHIGPFEAGVEDADTESLTHQKLVAEVNLKVQQARKARLKADEIEELLVSAEEAKRAWFTISRQTRDKLMSVPDRLAAQLATMSDEHAIYDELTREIRQALADLDDDLEEIKAA